MWCTTYIDKLNWEEASIIFPVTCVNNKIVYIYITGITSSFIV